MCGGGDPVGPVSESARAHHFTVDLEEYFQVSAFEGRVARSDWEGFESRVGAQTALLLDLMARHEARATFFVLGWLAERQPELIQAIARAGHAIASHGWDHVRVTHQTPHQFRDSVRRSKRVLEEITGAAVEGFRAPSFSIVPGKEWALDVLIEEGYRYDSSLFPVRRPGGAGSYGYPDGHPYPHWLDRPGGRLAEIPPSTMEWWGMRLPAAGGAYFRLFPYGLVRTALRQCERVGVSGTFYIHPWELDPEQPRFAVPWSTRVRHYGGLSDTTRRLDRLMAEFRFTPIESSLLLARHTSGAPVIGGA